MQLSACLPACLTRVMKTRASKSAISSQLPFVYQDVCVALHLKASSQPVESCPYLRMPETRTQTLFSDFEKTRLFFFGGLFAPRVTFYFISMMKFLEGSSTLYVPGKVVQQGARIKGRYVCRYIEIRHKNY